MAKGRKKVGVSNDLFKALNATAVKQVAKVRAIAREQASESKQAIMARRFCALAWGSEIGSDGKNREIRASNPAKVINIVLYLLDAGVPVEDIARDCHMTVRSARFNWNLIQDGVLAAFDESAGQNCNAEAACTIFGYTLEPVEAVEEFLETEAPEASEESEAVAV